MRLRPLINSSRTIIKSNRLLVRNNYSLISNNSEHSFNNVSSTTNASRINKIKHFPNILPKLVTPKHNFIIKKISTTNKNLVKSNSVTNISNTPISLSTLLIRQRADLFDNAEQILKERMNNQGVIKGGGKFLLKSIALRNSKDVSKKNYAINLLKQKRTQISEKERVINQAIKEFSEQFENDHRKFIYFVETEKRKQKEEEENMNNIKEEREKKEQLLYEEGLMNKRLDEMLERKIKEIFVVKAYGSFFNKVFGKKFVYDETGRIDSREKNFEEIANKIIEIYDLEDKDKPLPKELEDEELLMKKFLLFEDTIMMCLSHKESIDKEIVKQQKYFEKELDLLKLSLTDYESDYNYIKSEKNNVNIEMKNFKIHEDSSLEDILDMIIELGKGVGTKWPAPTSKNKKNLGDYVTYARKTLDILKNKEELINSGITEIESAILYGSFDDKKLMEKSIMERKKVNKINNLLLSKLYQEELKDKKKLKAIERAQKVVITGRKGINFSTIKNKKNLQKMVQKGKDDDFGHIYYSTDNEDN